MSSRFSSNYKAFALELLENPEEMYMQLHYNGIYLKGVKLGFQTSRFIQIIAT